LAKTINERATNPQDPDFVIKGELQWPFEQAVLANMKGIWRLLIDFPTRKILLQAQYVPFFSLSRIFGSLI